MEIITITHPLRSITLRYDHAVSAPAFETQALACYREMHDRTWDIKQRVNAARLKIPPIQIQIEELTAVFEEAKAKFKHLQTAYDTNPYKDTIRMQLKQLVEAINSLLDGFLGDLIALTEAFYDYDEQMVEADRWLYEVAFPQFNQIIQNYKDCSVDMVFFDEDLDDFKGVRSFVKKQEERYYEGMNALIGTYSDLNEAIEHFFDEIEAFDETLSTGG